MLRVALTGGIASGKSAAAAAFRELGVPVVDTDCIARDAVEPGSAGLTALTEEFGPGILENGGRLDRSALREAIFSDAGTRQRVNAILHPLILATVERELAALDAPYAIIEIPLLAETGLAGNFDRVLVVDAADHLRIQRLQARDGVSAAQARAALDAQATREERLRLADDVIENNGDLDALHRTVAELHSRYASMAKRFASITTRPAE